SRLIDAFLRPFFGMLLVAEGWDLIGVQNAGAPWVDGIAWATHGVAMLCAGAMAMMMVSEMLQEPSNALAQLSAYRYEPLRQMNAFLTLGGLVTTTLRAMISRG